MSTPNAHASSSKDHSKHKKHHAKDKDGHSHTHKHKSKSHGSKHSQPHEKKEKASPWEHRKCKMRLSIPPKYAEDWLSGIRDVLDGMLMRYVPQLEGVLVAHYQHEILDNTLKIIDECPYGVGFVEFDAILWSPQIGQKLYGTHSLSSPSHLSLLFARTFNISIPLQHIPLDVYKFEHTSPEDEDLDSDDESEDGLGVVEEVGRWRNIETGQLIGEDGKKDGKGIKFTVIGMQVTNNVLSLTGSLLADPTNPPPPPASVTTIQARSPSPSLSPEPTRPAKQPRQARPVQDESHTASHEAEAVEVIDDRFLSARELKKKRKDEEKKKRDARKARKEGRELEDIEQAAAGDLVNVQGDDMVPSGSASVGVKRKVKDEAEEAEKKRRKVAE